MKETPEILRMRGKEATKCTKVIKKGVLAHGTNEESRSDHIFKCSLMPGRKIKKKAAVRVVCQRSRTEDREEWQGELHRHCDEVKK